MTQVELVPLHRLNWEEVVRLEVAPEQQRFIPSNLYSIAQSRFEKNSLLYAIRAEGKTVGFAMLLLSDNVCWIARLMIDKHFQGRGYGYKALQQILQQMHHKARIHEVRVVVAKENNRAIAFFEKCGFFLKDELDDNEYIYFYPLR